jgi:opacity protein-like surface antigen
MDGGGGALMRAGTMAVALLCLAAPARAADDPYRFKVMVGGGYELGTQTFGQTISFDQYQEKATITNDYSAGAAPGADIGLQWNAFKHVGFSLAGTIFSRDLDVTYDASFPNPLFFDKPRSATGTVSGKQKETAAHVNVVAFGRSGAVDLSGWAGVSLFKVEADLLQNVLYSQTYPYDSVTVTSTPTARASDSPVGFNLGASADWRFATNVGVGLEARYAWATAKLAVPNAPTVEVHAGGFQVGLGLRFYF